MPAQTPPPATQHSSTVSTTRPAATSNAQLVILAGHCGPDGSYLRIAVQKAIPGATIRSAHDDSELSNLLASLPGEAPQPIVLVNRVLEPGFESEAGLDLVASLHRKRPLAKLVLVSNFPDAQAAAVKAGALPGFGKRDVGTPKLVSFLQNLAGK